jgi:translation initiation factor 4B
VEAEGAAPHLAELNNDWRSNRPARPPPSERSPPPTRRPSGPPDGPPHPAHGEQTWTIGSKFKPSVPAETVPERRSLFGGRRGDAPAGAGESPEEISDWRATPRRTVSHTGSTRGSRKFQTPLHSLMWM